MKMNDETSDRFLELARRLSTSFGSYRDNVSMDYYYRRHKDKQVGDFWMELARQLESSMVGITTEIKIEGIEPMIPTIPSKNSI